MKNRKPWTFCTTPEEKCTMNYCDENGCQNRARNLVDVHDTELCELCDKTSNISNMKQDREDGNWICEDCLK